MNLFFGIKKIVLSLLIVASLITSTLQPAVICNQLTSLAPEVMHFIAHTDGSLLAAQATANAGTCIAFYEFQKSTSEGRPAKLTQFSQLEEEGGQGIVYDWTKKKHHFLLGTPHGKITVYDILDRDEQGIRPEPVVLGEKEKHFSIKALAWSNDEKHFAAIANNKLTIYVLSPNSKKKRIKRVSSVALTIEDITFLQWSHDNGFIALGNTNEIVIFKTRDASGSLELSEYATKELADAMRKVGGNIKDIAWNKTSAPTLAILNTRITFLTLPTRSNGKGLHVMQNFATPHTSVLSWNAAPKACKLDLQELIVAEHTGRTYQVYTMTDKSLMFDTTAHMFLPPFHRDSTEMRNTPKSKHALSEITMLELVNKLINKPQ